MKSVDLRQFKQKGAEISNIIPDADLLILKQIHKNHTGIDLSDSDALTMGLRLIEIFSVIGQQISMKN